MFMSEDISYTRNEADEKVLIIWIPHVIKFIDTVYFA